MGCEVFRFFGRWKLWFLWGRSLWDGIYNWDGGEYEGVEDEGHFRVCRCCEEDKPDIQAEIDNEGERGIWFENRETRLKSRPENKCYLSLVRSDTWKRSRSLTGATAVT